MWGCFRLLFSPWGNFEWWNVALLTLLRCRWCLLVTFLAANEIAKGDRNFFNVWNIAIQLFRTLRNTWARRFIDVFLMHNLSNNYFSFGMPILILRSSSQKCHFWCRSALRAGKSFTWYECSSSDKETSWIFFCTKYCFIIKCNNLHF